MMPALMVARSAHHAHHGFHRSAAFVGRNLAVLVGVVLLQQLAECFGFGGPSLLRRQTGGQVAANLRAGPRGVLLVLPTAALALPARNTALPGTLTGGWAASCSMSFSMVGLSL